jgi:hypothetical protein
VKTYSVLNQAPRHEDVWRNGGTASRILNKDFKKCETLAKITFVQYRKQDLDNRKKQNVLSPTLITTADRLCEISNFVP